MADALASPRRRGHGPGARAAPSPLFPLLLPGIADQRFEKAYILFGDFNFRLDSKSGGGGRPQVEARRGGRAVCTAEPKVPDGTPPAPLAVCSRVGRNVPRVKKAAVSRGPSGRQEAAVRTRRAGRLTPGGSRPPVSLEHLLSPGGLGEGRVSSRHWCSQVRPPGRRHAQFRLGWSWSSVAMFPDLVGLYMAAPTGPRAGTLPAARGWQIPQAQA